jgi:nucleotide-binding universal stress UspA family protein
MLPLRTILHPTDFSPDSEHAYRVARALARDYKARLVVLHVLPAPPFIAPPEREWLSGAADGKHPKEWARLRELSRHWRLRQGRPAREIVTVAKGVGCELIVMGTHGRTGLRRALLGSVAEDVLRHAPCPVLTVRPELPAVSPPRTRRS